MTSRRRFPFWLLFVALVVVPLAEIWVLIQVGQVIGVWWTIALLIADSILGSWLIKREGTRAWAALSTTLASGRMPARELADGALIVAGGTLMLSPGFVTDTMGLLLILPWTRPAARKLLTRVMSRKMLDAYAPGYPSRTYPGPTGSYPGPDETHPGPGPKGPVVRGEVVDP